MSLITDHSLGLPHGPPFLFVRQLLSGDPGHAAECSTVFPDDDPIFAGHFPGNPIVPGVILTEALAQTAGIAAATGFPEDARPLFLLSAIKEMKFFGAVRPASEIRLRANKVARVGNLWQFKVAATSSGKTVAEGRLVLSLAPQSPSARLE